MHEGSWHVVNTQCMLALPRSSANLLMWSKVQIGVGFCGGAGEERGRESETIAADEALGEKEEAEG